MKNKKTTGLWAVRVEEVIISKLTLRGDGTEGNPYRRITEVFTKDGEFIAEHDPFKNEK